MSLATPELRALERRTAQDIPDVERDGYGLGYAFSTARGDLLPAWGTQVRKYALRALWRHDFNWMGQGAISGLIKKFTAARWEVIGKKRVNYFTDVLRQADFGAGWDVCLGKFLLDYFRYDDGGWIELIGSGNLRRPITGPVTGIAHLDSYYCYPTGDPEFPVVYFSRYGKQHVLHYTRILHLVDTPDGDQYRPGHGLCALSRAVSIAWQQIYAGRYITTKLDDDPPPGIAVASNINDKMLEQARDHYLDKQERDQRDIFGRVLWLYSTNPQFQAKLDYLTFSQAPEGWNYKEYTELWANCWALALNTDVQEIWQLTGGNLGSGAQSQVLHSKSQGKLFGSVLTQLERRLNDVLPASLEFTFKDRDPMEGEIEANTAKLWKDFVSGLPATTPEEQRYILASKVEIYKDAVTDEKGEIVRLPDVDPKEASQQTIGDDATPVPEDATEGNTQTQDSEKAVKSIQASQLDFEADFGDLISAGRIRDIESRRFDILARAHLQKYIFRAMDDGLEEGGVEEMDEDDQAEAVAQVAKQSKFITGLITAIYSEPGISDHEATLKPSQWFNLSIRPAYDLGRLSADRNGMYELVGDDGEKSCATCKRLRGQQHRMKDWAKKRLRPGIDSFNYECQNFNCKHKLVKTTGRAQGNF